MVLPSWAAGCIAWGVGYAIYMALRPPLLWMAVREDAWVCFQVSAFVCGDPVFVAASMLVAAVAQTTAVALSPTATSVTMTSVLFGAWWVCDVQAMRLSELVGLLDRHAGSRRCSPSEAYVVAVLVGYFVVGAVVVAWNRSRIVGRGNLARGDE